MSKHVKFLCLVATDGKASADATCGMDFHC
jgi:hypothetical protein